MQDNVDFQGMGIAELASLQFAVDFDDINLLDYLTTPAGSPRFHNGLNVDNLSFPSPQEEEGKTDFPATEPATKETGAAQETETVPVFTAPNAAADSSLNEPIRVLNLGNAQNLSADQLALLVSNGSGASAAPVVSTAVLNAPHVEPQSKQFPWNELHSNLPSSAEGLVPSIQDGELVQMVYPSSNDQYDNFFMIQTLAGAPNESIINNQLLVDNVAANNYLTAPNESVTNNLLMVDNVAANNYLTAPNESITHNQLMVDNVAANNYLTAPNESITHNQLMVDNVAANNYLTAPNESITDNLLMVDNVAANNYLTAPNESITDNLLMVDNVAANNYLTAPNESITHNQPMVDNVAANNYLTAPNESITHNQLMVDNVAANNDLTAIFNRQPSLLQQQNPAQVGDGLLGSGNLGVAPQRSWNPTWPHYNQIPQANSCAPNYMNWDQSISSWPELYSHGEPNHVPVPPNSFGHQHGYRPILTEQVAPTRHATQANYHPQPAPFVRTHNSMGSGSSMPQRQRNPTLDNLQRNQNHSQTMMSNAAVSVRPSVSRFAPVQMPGSAGITSSGSGLLSTRAPRNSWLSRPLRFSPVQPHTASSSGLASPSGKQAGEELLRILNKNNHVREGVTSPVSRFATRESSSQGSWTEKLQRQLKRASIRLEESRKVEELSMLGHRSRQTELIEPSSSFKRQKNNQGLNVQSTQRAVENENCGKNKNSSSKREIVNSVYDAQFSKVGLAVDPHLRMFISSQFNVGNTVSDQSYPRGKD